MSISRNRINKLAKKVAKFSPIAVPLICLKCSLLNMKVLFLSINDVAWIINDDEKRGLSVLGKEVNQ